MSTLKRNGRQQSTISDVIEEIEDDTSADDDSVKSTKSEDQEKEVRKALKEAFEDTEQTLNKQLVLDIQTAFEVLDLEEISDTQFLNTLSSTFGVKFKKSAERQVLRFFRTEKNIIKVSQFVEFMKRNFSDNEEEGESEASNVDKKASSRPKRPNSALRKSNVSSYDTKPIRPRSGGRDRGSSVEQKEPDESAEETEGSIDGKVDDVTDDEEPTADFVVGEKVDARFRGKKKLYPGKIAKVHKTTDPNTLSVVYKYDIDYDDGDKDFRLDADSIVSKEEGGSLRPTSGKKKQIKDTLAVSANESKRTGSDAAESEDDDPDSNGTVSLKPDFAVGDRVEARFRGNIRKPFYKGKIAKVKREPSASKGIAYAYDIDYDDGDKDRNLSSNVIRKLKEESTEKEPLFSEGDKIKAHFRGKKTKKCYPGKIARVHKIKELGDIKYKYDIDYDDGDKDKLIPEDLIFPLEDKSEEPSLPDETDEEAKPPFEEGDKVEAQFRGRPRMRFYPGTIQKVHRTKDPESNAANFTFDILYDDGDNDKGLPEKCIKRRDSDKENKSATKPVATYKLGQRIKAHFRGRLSSIVKNGKIVKVHTIPGSLVKYDVDYDDGTKDTNLPESAVKENDDEEEDGTDTEGVSNPKFDVGAKVKARYRGRPSGPLLTGKVTGSRKRKDPITKEPSFAYDIEYDDGQKDENILEKVVEAVDMEADTAEGKADTDTDNEEGVENEFQVGDMVEAHFRGDLKKKKYSGKIAKVHKAKDLANGGWKYQYDIDYEDGDKDRRIDTKAITLTKRESARSNVKELKDSDDKEPTDAKFRVGDKVKARPGGDPLKRFAEGKITKVYSKYDPLSRKYNCVYDIKLNNGNMEKAVKEKSVQKVGADDKKPVEEDDEPAPFSEGQRVEAHFRGNKRKKRYAGKISKVKSRKDILSGKLNYTFDIDYDDGDKDKDLPPNVIFSLEDEIESDTGKLADESSVSNRSRTSIRKTSEGDEPESKFKEGDRVKARFRGDPRKKFYYGKISKVHKITEIDDAVSYLYDIIYDDGDTDKRLKPTVIQKVEEAETGVTSDKGEESDKTPESKFSVGDRVEAHFRGNPRKKLYKGTVARLHRSGKEFLYDIDYDDGDKDKRVPEKLTYPLDEASPKTKDQATSSSSRAAYQVGDKVKVKDKNRPSKLNKGKIVKVHRRSSSSGLQVEYDLHYENGQKEFQVPANRIDSMLEEEPEEEGYTSPSASETGARRRPTSGSEPTREDRRKVSQREDSEKYSTLDIAAPRIIEPVASSDFGENKQLIGHVQRAEMGMLVRDLAQLRIDLLPTFLRLCAEQKARSRYAEDVELREDVAIVPVRPDELTQWLEARFTSYDRERTHYISKDALLSAMARLQVTLTTRELRAIRSAFRRRGSEEESGPSKISYKSVAKLFGGSFATAIGVLESVENQSRSRRSKGERRSSSRSSKKRSRTPEKEESLTLDSLLDNADTSAFFSELRSTTFPEGTLAHWLQTTASPVEQNNFAEFLTLLSYFERRVGLQQRSSGSRTSTALHSMIPGVRREQPQQPTESDILQPEVLNGVTPYQNDEDVLVIQLGTRLRAGLRFYT